MFRLVFTLAGVVLIGLGVGYFMWGSRVANLTESLNSMVLEQETLRARLAAAEGRTPVAPPPPATGDNGEAAASDDDTPAPAGKASVEMAVSALKDEVQYQAKLIDEQSRVLNRLLEASEREGGPALQTCQENAQVLTGELQRCRAELSSLRTRPGSAQPERLPEPPTPRDRGIPVPPRY